MNRFTQTEDGLIALVGQDGDSLTINPHETMGQTLDTVRIGFHIGGHYGDGFVDVPMTELPKLRNMLEKIYLDYAQEKMR